MTVIDICILSTLNGYPVLSDYVTDANVFMKNLQKEVGEVSILCDLNQARRYAFSVPSIPKDVCHFSYRKPQQVLTFHGIIEGPKEFHPPHTKNLHAPQGFPNGRVCREATKDQRNPLRGK